MRRNRGEWLFGDDGPLDEIHRPLVVLIVFGLVYVYIYSEFELPLATSPAALAAMLGAFVGGVVVTAAHFWTAIGRRWTRTYDRSLAVRIATKFGFAFVAWTALTAYRPFVLAHLSTVFQSVFASCLGIVLVEARHVAREESGET